MKNVETLSYIDEELLLIDSHKYALTMGIDRLNKTGEALTQIIMLFQIVDSNPQLFKYLLKAKNKLSDKELMDLIKELTMVNAKNCKCLDNLSKLNPSKAGPFSGEVNEVVRLARLYMLNKQGQGAGLGPVGPDD